MVAVSGGIDSVVLLTLLRGNPSLQLVVAHFDHGIRSDSAEDTAFVAGLAKLYELEFVAGYGQLGPDASEDTARRHRYAFLEDVRARHGAAAIVTAHHQDDVIETALLNIVRGTRRRGLVSLQSTDSIKRPLLGVTKDEIRDYAVLHKLEWVEDSTNLEMKYARNRVRAQLYKHLTNKKRHEIAKLLRKIDEYNSKIDNQVNEILMNYDKTLPKRIITTTDEVVAAEIIAEWLRRNKATFDKKAIERLYSGIKNLQNSSKIDVDKHYYCLLNKHEIVLTERESV